MKLEIQRNRVRSFILSELLNGRLEIGDRLSLPYFSKKLNCSVTPIREALTQLEYAKVIQAVPNRGFIIPELEKKEAKNLYELVAALESLAVENSFFTVERISMLEKLQFNFIHAIKPLDRISADFAFHKKLADLYQNNLVQEKIRDCKIRIFSYEKLFLSDSGYSSKSAFQHQKIIDALKISKPGLASKYLKQNWLFTLKQIQTKF